MQITPQSQQYGLSERKARPLPTAKEVADLMRGPSIPHGTMKRSAQNPDYEHQSDHFHGGSDRWQQIPQAHTESPEQWVRSTMDGRSALVHNQNDPHWAWEHYDTDINGPDADGTEYPSHSGDAVSREEAMGHADNALGLHH